MELFKGLKADLEAQAQREADQKQRERQQVEERRSRDAAVQARKAQLRADALGFRDESHLLEVINSFVEVMGQENGAAHIPGSRIVTSNRDAVLDAVVWGRIQSRYPLGRHSDYIGDNYYQNYEHHARSGLEVETRPDGLILVKAGGWFSTFGISRSSWIGNPKSIADIFEKAYSRPKQIVVCIPKARVYNDGQGG